MTGSDECGDAPLGLESRQVLPLIEHLARLGRREAETAVGAKGLRPRHLVAMRLLALDGPAGQRDLTDALSLDPSNVVGLLNELEQRELIVRRRDPADRRRHIVELSARGEEELRAAYRSIDGVEDQLFAALTPADRVELHRLLSAAIGSGSSECGPVDHC